MLIWGASGGLGSFAVQHVLNSGGTPIGVVSSANKVETLRELGCEHVIDRAERGLPVLVRRAHPGRVRVAPPRARTSAPWSATDPDIVFEHPGRSTMGASVFVAKRGGTIVTCAATSGYMIEYDNRHLWMKLKTIKGSHFSNYREAWAANQAIIDGRVVPPLSAVFPLEEVGEATCQVHHNRARGQDRRALRRAGARGSGSPTTRRARAWARRASRSSGATTGRADC